MSRRVVIVGAGPGGLAAALLLARSGAEVTVVERQPRVGGRTSALEADGFRFDLGPTFFLYPQILEEIFAATGHELRREVELVRLDPQYRLVFGAGGQMDATPDVPRMQREIARLHPPDAANLVRYLADNRRKLELFRPILSSPMQSWRDLLRLPLHRLLPVMRPWQSVHGDLRTFFSDPRVRLAFCFQSKYLGMSPFRCPSLFSILAFLEYEHGVHHPIGGCAAVCEAMARLARRMGVQILLDEPVEEVLFAGPARSGCAPGRACTTPMPW